MVDRKLFRTRLQMLRIRDGLSQAALADMVNSSAMTISHYETGFRFPGVDRIVELALVFNTSVDFLVGKDLVDVAHRYHRITSTEST